MVDCMLDRIREGDEIDEVHVVTNHKFAAAFAELGERRADVDVARRRHDERTRPARRDRRHPVRHRRGRARRRPARDRGRQPLRLQRRRLRATGGSGKGEASAVAALRRRRPRARRSKYGIVEVDEDERIVAFIEKPEEPPSDARRDRDLYLPPRARAPRPHATSTRATRPTSPGSFVAWLVPRAPVYGYRFDGEWRDIGDAEQLLEADNRLRELAGLPARDVVFPRLDGAAAVATTELRTEDIRWDLTDLAADAEEARAQLDDARRARARSSPSRYRGTIASLDAPALRALLDELDELEQELSRLQVYSYLRLSMAATDVEANDLATFARDRGAEIENALVFVGLEWIALDDDRAEELLASDGARAVRAQAARRAAGEAVRPAARPRSRR